MSVRTSILRRMTAMKRRMPEQRTLQAALATVHSNTSLELAVPVATRHFSNTTYTSFSCIPRTKVRSYPLPFDSIVRSFQSEGEYHTIADEALHTLQDSLDEVLEGANVQEYELTVASGVLTLQLPPHGTWVLNKQTPNQQ